MKVWLWFGLFCLLSGSGWLVEEYVQLPLPGLLRVCVHAAILALLFLSIQKWQGLRQAKTLRIMGWAAVLLALPAIAVAAAGGRVGELSIVLVFTLVPTFTVFLVAQAGAGFGQANDGLRLLVPALAGVGGAGLLLPFSPPSSGRGWAWLGVLILVALASAYAAVRLHTELAAVPQLLAGGLLSASLALCAGAFLWLPAQAAGVLSMHAILGEVLVCLLLDGPILLLTAWLLRAMRPIAFSSRFLLVPLVTMAEGFFLLHPAPAWTPLAGALLMAAGSVVLLRTGDSV